MGTTFDHNRFLKKFVKERLLPCGIVQHVKSRTFLYDNGWWTIIIEFQSSSFSKGTYLNIGVDFNFYPQEHFAFTYGYREKGFQAAENEKQFEELIYEYCDHTISKIEELKTKFIDVHSAIRNYRKVSTNSGWDNFNLGILHGIAGELSQADKYLRKVVKAECVNKYEFDRQKLASDIRSWLGNYNVFIENTKQLIIQTRQMKKLPATDLGNLQDRKTTHISTFAIWRRMTSK